MPLTLLEEIKNLRGQRAHDPAFLAVADVLEKMLASISGGSGSGISVFFKEVTKTELDALVAVDGLTPGTFYKISGVHDGLFNDSVTSTTTIVLQATSNKELNRNGLGVFYNPKYDITNASLGIWGKYKTVVYSPGSLHTAGNLVTANNGATGIVVITGSGTSLVIRVVDETAGLWSAATTFDSGSSTISSVTAVTPQTGNVVWGNYKWQNTSNLSGTATDDLTLSNQWTKIPYYDLDNYTIVVDEISYDYTNDFITSRRDPVNNIHVVCNAYEYDDLVDTFSIPMHPISAMQWGFPKDDSLIYTRSNISVLDSYCNLVNFQGLRAEGIGMNKGSLLDGNTFYGNARLQNVIIDNGSFIRDNVIAYSGGVAGIISTVLINGSSISDNNITEINGCSLDMGSILNFDSDGQYAITGLVIRNWDWNFEDDILTQNLQDITVDGNNVLSLAERDALPTEGLPEYFQILLIDSGDYTPQAWYNGQWNDLSGGGGGTQGFEDVIIEDNALTADRTINLASHALIFAAGISSFRGDGVNPIVNITQTGTADTAQYLRFMPIAANGSPFCIGNARYRDVNPPGNPDPDNYVWNFGVNVDATGSKIDTTKPAISFSWEQNFADNPQSEIHLVYTAPGSGGQYRIFSFQPTHDGTDLPGYFTVNTMWWNNLDAEQFALLGNGGDFRLFGDTPTLQFLGANGGNDTMPDGTNTFIRYQGKDFAAAKIGSGQQEAYIGPGYDQLNTPRFVNLGTGQGPVKNAIYADNTSGLLYIQPHYTLGLRFTNMFNDGTLVDATTQFFQFKKEVSTGASTSILSVIDGSDRYIQEVDADGNMTIGGDVQAFGIALFDCPETVDAFRVFDAANGTDAMNVNTTDKIIAFDSGGGGYSMGIKTLTPSAVFDVNGDVHIEDDLTITSLAGGGIVTANGSGKLRVVSGDPVLRMAISDLTGQTAAVSNVITYNTPSPGGTYRIGGYINITAASASTITLKVTYTDENSNSVTQIIPLTLASTGAISTTAVAISNNSATDIQIRVLGSTAITVLTTVTGVSRTYDVGATIESLR